MGQEHEQEDLQVEESSFLDLPDDELASLDLSQLVAQASPVEPEAPAAQASEDEGSEAEGDEEEAHDEPAGEEGDAAAEEAEREGEEQEEVPETKSPEAESDKSDEKETESEEVPETAPVNYEEEYKKLTAPFRANGKEIQVKSADDAIALMQMGANYNKKMAALKPNLKLLKLLENNGLLSEEKLSFLIDLDKKNPDAISKLIKDSGIDPLDMDVSKSEYKPKTYTVDDRELELDAVLEKIQDTPTYARTIDVVSTKWDGPSKQVIAQHPQVLEVINDHIDRGIYDLITAEMERERLFGRLSGMSDIDAYRAVGDAMNARGAFAHLAQPAQQPAPATVREPVPAKPKAEDPAIRAKKLAASSPKAAAPVKADSDFNPLALSDDEFSKIGNPRLM